MTVLIQSKVTSFNISLFNLLENNRRKGQASIIEMSAPVNQVFKMAVLNDSQQVYVCNDIVTHKE
jgi:hypothetical protein